MTQKQAKQIIENWQAGLSSDEEIKLLEDWLLYSNLRELDLPEKELQQELQLIHDKLFPIKQISPLKRMLPYAAAILLIGLTGLWFAKETIWQDKDKDFIEISWENSGIKAASPQATLTLSDGKTLQLSSEHDGIKMGEDITYADGQFLTTSSDPNLDKNRENHLLKLSTPRGGIYQLELSDGTKVWLNAASEITYSSKINQQKREIFLSGEAFFEVKPLKDKDGQKVPFIIHTSSQKIEVVGTSFNVFSYSDEEISKTTLIEGLVDVAAIGFQGKKRLSPGRQAVIKSKEGEILIRDVNTVHEMGWKNSTFDFDDEPLHMIMRKISRWYNVDVHFLSDVNQQERFGGSFPRTANIQDVLRKIELTGDIKFKIEGGNNKERRIIVMK
ncbi:FecR family protein [Sphingobacterium humi]|uniref:DUF4974 domain-containing protein n=1 Tax=Sphingobacterium humi TaxID=1796905 RepID=A0A6N8KZK9_9SPHI|nr:FecR family protein [Sphingobacterium humi]MVZ62169.1 DUF4974 domain-containing protein [Sphingobacterium humi]